MLAANHNPLAVDPVGTATAARREIPLSEHMVAYSSGTTHCAQRTGIDTVFHR